MRRLLLAIVVVMAVFVGAVALDVYGATDAPRSKPPADGPLTSVTVERVAESGAPTGSVFTMSVVSMTECGTTCRDLAVRITNTGDRPQDSIGVLTTVSVGADRLWRDRSTIARLRAGQSRTLDKRVDVGPTGALKIGANDGYVLVVTRVTTTTRTERHERYLKTA
jgi:hypothetical protein